MTTAPHGRGVACSHVFETCAPALEQTSVASPNRLQVKENPCTVPPLKERAKGKTSVDNGRTEPENRVVNRIHRQSKKTNQDLQVSIFKGKKGVTDNGLR